MEQINQVESGHNTIEVPTGGNTVGRESEITPSTTSVQLPTQKQPRLFHIALTIAVTVFVLIAGYLLFKNNEQKNIPINASPSPTPAISTPVTTPDLTSNWKTYTNKVHQISFKYPLGWGLIVEDDQAQYNASIKLKKDEAMIQMVFGVDGIGGSGTNYEGVPYVLDGNNVFLYKVHNTYNNSETMGITDKLTASLGVLMMGKKTYILSLNYPAKYVKSGESTELDQVFEQILSTFRFSQANGLTDLYGATLPATWKTSQVVPVTRGSVVEFATVDGCFGMSLIKYPPTTKSLSDFVKDKYKITDELPMYGVEYTNFSYPALTLTGRADGDISNTFIKAPEAVFEMITYQLKEDAAPSCNLSTQDVGAIINTIRLD